jgi:hypothetical protein
VTERPRAEHHSTLGGLHLQISKLLVVVFVIAIAATGALIVTLLTQMPPGQSPPPGPSGMPPPPPGMRPLAIFSLMTGFFVLAWLAVLVVFARDQILRQLRQSPPAPAPGVTAEQLRDLRTEIAGDLSTLGDRMAELTTEYGERRETDGYLGGMRTATTGEPPEANVRAFRRTPPPR